MKRLSEKILVPLLIGWFCVISMFISVPMGLTLMMGLVLYLYPNALWRSLSLFISSSKLDDRKISIQAARLLLGSLSLHFFALSFRTHLAGKVHPYLFHVLVPSHILRSIVS